MRECYFAARPETLVSIVNTGHLPEALPIWIKNREIKLYLDAKEAAIKSTTTRNQTFILKINLPEIENNSFITFIEKNDSSFFKASQIDKDWIKQIYVNSETGKKLATNLLNSNSHASIEIKKDIFLEEKTYQNKSFFTFPVKQPEKKIKYMKQGDLLGSNMQTLVNTVNCVGVMGKGIALSFKKRFPDMFKDYKNKCKKNEVRLGMPYIFHVDLDRKILNFPTKGHWQQKSKIIEIENGLKFLVKNIENWGITSMAIPPLGCGNGGLNWEDVKPLIEKYLGNLNMPIEIFVPFEKPKKVEKPLFNELNKNDVLSKNIEDMRITQKSNSKSKDDFYLSPKEDYPNKKTYPTIKTEKKTFENIEFNFNIEQEKIDSYTTEMKNKLSVQSFSDSNVKLSNFSNSPKKNSEKSTISNKINFQSSIIEINKNDGKKRKRQEEINDPYFDKSESEYTNSAFFGSHNAKKKVKYNTEEQKLTDFFSYKYTSNETLLFTDYKIKIQGVDGVDFVYKKNELRILAIDKNKKILGSIDVEMEPDGTYWFSHIEVEEEYRKKFIGRTLIKALVLQFPNVQISTISSKEGYGKVKYRNNPSVEKLINYCFESDLLKKNINCCKEVPKLDKSFMLT